MSSREFTRPTTLRAATTISLPIEACWERLRDLSRESDYVPGLISTVITTPIKEGVGASRIVTNRKGSRMRETVTEWDEGRGVTLRLNRVDTQSQGNLDKAPTPFKFACFRYTLRETPTGTEAETLLTYELPFGLLGRIVDILVLRRLLRRSVIDTTLGLAENYQTDKPVTKADYARLRANAPWVTA